jgi:hypothetical protein
MKLQLTYDRPSQIQTDLLIVVLDEKTRFHDLSGSPLQEAVQRVAQDFKDKKLKTGYFTALDPKSGVKNLLVFSTELSKAHNVWETFKIFVARGIRVARDHGFQRITIALNTNDAAPFVGKAVEGVLLGAYTFDRYKKEKSTINGMQVQLAALKENDAGNRHYLDRYTLVSNAVNEARSMINEPGSVVTPQYMAEAAQAIAEQSNLDVKIWDEKRLQKGWLQRPASGRTRERESSAVDSADVSSKESKTPPGPRGERRHVRFRRHFAEARRQNVGNEGRHVRRRCSPVCHEGDRKTPASRERDGYRNHSRKFSGRERPTAWRHLLRKERQIHHGG